MKEINQIKVHSEEIQELMGKIPGWIVRSGLTLVFVIILSILLGSYFFNYSEIVKAPLIIVTHNTPLPLNAKSSGKIDMLFVSNEQKVQVGKEIALIENTTSYEDLLKLEDNLLKIKGNANWDSLLISHELPHSVHLGSLQQAYASFAKKWVEFGHYLRQDHLYLKKRLLDEQIKKYETIVNRNCEQLVLMDQDLGLFYESYSRDSLLFFTDKSLISKAEYEKSLQGYLQKCTSIKDFENNIENKEIGYLKLKETRLDLNLKLDHELTQFRLSLSANLQLLRSAIEEWRYKYIVVTPIAGTITFTNFWNDNQVIKSGESIATIIPLSHSYVIAKATIPLSAIGKVETGQLVHIKLSGFPYMEFGVLKGKIETISKVPDEEGFIAQIILTNGMTSSYNKELRLIQRMDGEAEIITKKQRLIYKLINPLKALFDKLE